jgi:hypothetical protein
MAPPAEIEWSRLSPAAREAAAQTLTRLSAGYSYQEVADQIQAVRDGKSIRHLELPKTRVTTGWISSALKQLRREIEAQVAEKS